MNTINSLFPRTDAIWGEVNLDEQARLDFPTTEVENQLLDPEICKTWLRKLAKIKQVTYTYGGYFENRSYLWRGSYLKPEQSIHLGIDVNFYYPREEVLCPVDFEVREFFKDHDQNGGWGGRVTVETEKGFVVFAHIEPDADLKFNTKYKAGTTVGRLSYPESNGGWFVHLHLQGLRSLSQLSNLDGYGGFEQANYIEYPNPFTILNIKTT